MTKCNPKSVHIPTQERLHRKKCLLPDDVQEAGNVAIIFDTFSNSVYIQMMAMVFLRRILYPHTHQLNSSFLFYGEWFNVVLFSVLLKF